jgi:hypothetical protein
MPNRTANSGSLRMLLPIPRVSVVTYTVCLRVVEECRSLYA